MNASIESVIHTFLEALLLVVVVVFFISAKLARHINPPYTSHTGFHYQNLYFFFVLMGFSINTLNLFAMVLAIGILVDNAIVVVEAVHHHIDHNGLSVKQVSLRAMKEVGGSIVAITLILRAVFVPVAFIPGIAGALYQQFAATIAVSVVLSALVALTLTPALCSLLIRPKINENSKQRSLQNF